MSGELRLEAVSVQLNHKTVLENFSLTLPASGLVCLFGPSGCGKTTLLRLLAGLQQPQTGMVHGLEGRRIAMVFQENRLLPWLSVLENVTLVAPGDTTRALACLEYVELEKEAAARPAALSGGMQRRLAIARALAYDGDILLLDEPFNGLDEALAQRIMETIRTLYRQRLIVLISHDQALARAYAELFLRLQGPPLQITEFGGRKTE